MLLSIAKPRGKK